MQVHGDTIEIFKALSTAQREFEAPTKDKKGHNYLYADLADAIEATRKPLAENGLAVVQEATTELHERGIVVVVATYVTHVSGAYIEFGPLMMVTAKTDPQSVGTAITYARRYAYLAALGVAADDDDGAAASQPVARAAQATPQRRNAKQAAQVPSSLGDVEPDAGDVDAVDGTLGDLRDEFYSVGQEKYGDEWDDKRHAFCAAMKVPSSNELSASQLRKLIDGMRNK